MGFATSADTNYEGNSIPTLPIGIYDNGTLVNAVREKDLKKDDGTPLEDRITINFKTADGQPYAKSELKPDVNAADFDKKSDNVTKRIGHILSKFYTKDQLVQSNTDWDGYANWAVQMLNAANKSVKVKFAIVGSVYVNAQGVKKASTGFPNYPPFIVKAGADLNFDANALKSNAEYTEFQRPPAPDAPAAGTPNTKTTGEF